MERMGSMNLNVGNDYCLTDKTLSAKKARDQAIVSKNANR
jgi:hypothetical protein